MGPPRVGPPLEKILPDLSLTFRIGSNGAETLLDWPLLPATLVAIVWRPATSDLQGRERGPSIQSEGGFNFFLLRT